MTDVMNFVQTFHGHWRWIVALVAVVAAVKFLLGVVNKSKVAQIDKTIATAFAGVMTVQFRVSLTAHWTAGVARKVAE